MWDFGDRVLSDDWIRPEPYNLPWHHPYGHTPDELEIRRLADSGIEGELL